MIEQDEEVLSVSRPDPHGEGRERALLLAVIQQALLDVLVPPIFQHVKRLKAITLEYRKKRMAQWLAARERALSWLLEEHDEKAKRPMSLDWICTMLGLCADAVRHRLRVTLGIVIDSTTKPFEFRGVSV